jgi:hypothetical protein
MNNEELLNEFSKYLDAALNMNLEESIRQVKAIPKEARNRDRRSRYYGDALSIYKLRFRYGFSVRDKMVAVVRSYGASHSLALVTYGDRLLYRERTLERDAMRTFWKFLQMHRNQGR